jgi:hypothetical protein
VTKARLIYVAVLLLLVVPLLLALMGPLGANDGAEI